MGVMDMKTDQFRTTRSYTHHLNILLREPGVGSPRELPSLECLHSFYYPSQVVPFLWLVFLWSGHCPPGLCFTLKPSHSSSSQIKFLEKQDPKGEASEASLSMWEYSILSHKTGGRRPR